MRLRTGLMLYLVFAGAIFLAPARLWAQTDAPPAPSDARELAGLWDAKLRYGPDMRGPLIIEGDGKAWRAEIAGRSTEAHLSGETLEFELPDNHGGFRGAFTSGQKRIVGHWFEGGDRWRVASPVTLTRIGKTERWRGVVIPLDGTLTMYLKVEPAADGSMRAFLKNPERNFGIFMRVASLTLEGTTVRLHSAARPARPATASQPAMAERPARVISEGKLDEEGTISIPLRGGTYDFRRVDDGAASDFYPRSRPHVGKDYVYRVPPALLDDGWPVGTPEKVGMSREALAKFVRMIIDTPIDSLNSPEIHGVLVARHGTLVLEEYFHGEHRDKPHDTRSAAKSVASVLVGAAMQSGVDVSEKSFVYQVMNGGTFPEGLEPRKRALTLEHLLTMSSGLDADDNDDDSPGGEDKVSEESDDDYWDLMLGLNMVREPGEKAVYASMGSNLVGGVVRRASGRPLPELFHELLAEPLEISRYWLNITPSGEAYNGGGTRFLPRDFMKFGQLMVNGGTWNGKRVVSEDWVKKSTSHSVDIGKGKYGYLWWIIDYPYQGRTIQAFYAAGNGGQVVMGIPDLDVVVAIYGGNYNDRVIFKIQRELVPEYVLPAVAGK